MRPWEIGPHDFFEPVEAVRELFAQVIGGDADGVAILPAVSYGVAVAANNLTTSPGQRILLLAEQFPSNVYQWHDLAGHTGADLVTVPRPADQDWTSAVLGLIDDRTAICAVEPCHWSDGGLLDLVKVGERLREVGATFVVDGTQSVGAMPIDVEQVRPDFLFTAVYKWLLAPYGCALMWCAPAHRDGRPLELSWITRERSDDFAHVADYQHELRAGARRFDVGQTSNFAMIPAVGAALEQTLEWGVSRICEYSQGFTEEIASRAAAMGLSVAPADRRAPHLLGVQLGDADPQRVAASMAKAGVYVSVRGSAMRVSPHVYNTQADVDRLIEALEAAL
jgi:selenocysteine lyase/cysteine desulfurase